MSDQNQLSPETQNAIIKALSTVRLQPYLREANGQIDNAMKIYQLNLQLCATLYPSLHIFEITFRNQMNRALQDKYGRNWYEGGSFNIQQRAQQSIEDAKNKVIRQRRPLTHNSIISELTLGFWSAFITKDEYRQSVFDQCIQQIFPYAKSSERTFTKITPRFQTEILYLRNRVFHHEPIWEKNYKIKQKYEYLCQVLGWMNPEILSWLQTYDNFLEVYKSASDSLKTFGSF